MKHFAVVDITDGNNAVVGIIQTIPLTKVGLESLKERLVVALSDYLDSDDFNVGLLELEDLQQYGPVELIVEIDGINYYFELQETFFY